MRTERRRSRALASRLLPLVAGLALSSAAAAGCAAPSSTADMARIRELSRFELPPSAGVGGGRSGAGRRRARHRPGAAAAAHRGRRGADRAAQQPRAARRADARSASPGGNLEQAGQAAQPRDRDRGDAAGRRRSSTRTLELGVEIDLHVGAPLAAPRERAARGGSRGRALPRRAARWSISATRCAPRSTPCRRRSSASGIANRALDAFAAARDAARALFEAGNVPSSTWRRRRRVTRRPASRPRRSSWSSSSGASGSPGCSASPARQTSWTIAGAVPAAPDALATPPRAESRALPGEPRARGAAQPARGGGGARRALRARGLGAGRGGLVHGERELGASDEAHEHPWVVGAGVRLSLAALRSAAGRRGRRRRRSSTPCWSATTGAPSTSARRSARRATGWRSRTRAPALPARDPPGAQARPGADVAPVQRDAGRRLPAARGAPRAARRRARGGRGAARVLDGEGRRSTRSWRGAASRPRGPRRSRGDAEGRGHRRRRALTWTDVAFIHAGGLAAGAAILTRGLAHAQQRPGAPPAAGAATPPPRRTAAPGGSSRW